MSTPIKSSSPTGPTANIAGVSPALNDLMSRLNAQAQGATGRMDAETPQQAFSRWLEKHASGAEGARRPEQTPPANAGGKSQASQAAQALQNNVATSRAAEQVLARVRQLGSPAAKPTTAAPHAADPNAPTDGKLAKAARAEQNNAAKSARKEGAAKPAQADQSDKADAKEEAAREGDEVNFSTQMGDGAAVVRELTPPPTIQAGDAAGMMAWLASLTQGGDPQAQSMAAGELVQADQNDQGKDGADATALDLSAKGRGAGRGHPGGMTLELQAWQGVSSKAEAAMEQLSQGRLEDPMAGLMAGGAAKASSFGQILNDAAQNVRHESATLTTPFGSPEFPQALAEKVSMWVNTARDDGPMTAELHLNPAEMGPINVKISLDGQSAHVDFAAAALETRQAIEASMATLSSALSDVGLSLTGGGVSSQTSQQAFEQATRDGSGGNARGSGRALADGESDNTEGLATRQVSAPRPGRAGGLDLYA